MNILELINYKDLTIEVSSIKYNYFHVTDFNNLHFSYGFCKEGWIINDNEKLSLIPFGETNFISFIKLLEIPYDDLVNNIQKAIEEEKTDELYWTDLIPIVGIIKTSFNIESVYWSELSLDFLLQAKFYSDELSVFLNEKAITKWGSQKLKHKIKTYFSRSEKSSNE